MPVLVVLLLSQVAAPSMLADAQRLPVIQGARFPALSPDAKQVAFSYRGDLWVANIASRVARRLTVSEGYEYRAVWSRDGRYIAFASDRYGNNDVFVMPAEGGTIARLTYHSANDRPVDWSPDGRRLLIASARETRFQCPYEVDVDTGRAIKVMEDITSLTPGMYAPDGQDFLCVRGGGSWWRIGYRGATNPDIYIYDREANELRRLTDFDGRDEWPLYSPDGRQVYFVSERDGAPNIYRLDVASGATEAITKLDDDGAMWPSISADGSTIVFEHANGLWTVPAKGGDPKELRIGAPIDYVQTFESRKSVNSGVTELEVAPDGKLLAVCVNGDILFLRPEFENDSIRLTDHPGNDSDFMWSPDSKKLVFTSDRTGNSDLFIADAETLQVRQLTNTPEYEHAPRFNPKGDQVYFTRSAADGLYAIPAEGGDIKQVHPGPFVEEYSFSPCGHWLALGLQDTHGTRDLWIVPAEGGEAHNITKYPGGNYSPVWDPNGGYLFFVSTRTGNGDIYSVRLTKDVEKFDDYQAQEEEKAKREGKKPAPPEKPAEGGEKKPDGGNGAGTSEAPQGGEAQPVEGEAKPAEEAKPEKEPIAIDFDDIENRARRLTSTNEGEGNLTIAPKGDKLVYTVAPRGDPQVWQMKPDGEDAKPFISGNVAAGALRWTASGDRLYYSANGKPYYVGGGGGGGAEVSFRFEYVDDARVRQVAAFNQAWMALDERFYDGNFHGVDWKAIREKYAKMVDGTLVPGDFNIVVQRMIGELNASHLGCYGGGVSGPETGLLGLDYDESYEGPGAKVTRCLYNGPCTKAGSEVGPGEYILQINGKDVQFGESLFDALKGTVGKRVKLTVNSKPETEGARTVSVKPIGGGEWGNLRYEQWVRDNRKMVLELSNGRLYYLHIRSMDGASLERFRRDLFGEAQRYEGLVIDVRYNGGGRIHDDLLEELTKKVHVYENQRNAPAVTQPIRQYDKPKVLLINEHCASDSEIFPNGFREKKLGKIIGVRTYGGVIGTYDITLLNGHGFRVPVTGWYTLDGTNLENYGVPPDIEVPYPYEAYRDGRDPQIEAAVAELLKAVGAPEERAAP